MKRGQRPRPRSLNDCSPKSALILFNRVLCGTPLNERRQNLGVRIKIQQTHLYHPAPGRHRASIPRHLKQRIRSERAVEQRFRYSGAPEFGRDRNLSLYGAEQFEIIQRVVGERKRSRLFISRPRPENAGGTFRRERNRHSRLRPSQDVQCRGRR